MFNIIQVILIKYVFPNNSAVSNMSTALYRNLLLERSLLCLNSLLQAFLRLKGMNLIQIEMTLNLKMYLSLRDRKIVLNSKWYVSFAGI